MSIGGRAGQGRAVVLKIDSKGHMGALRIEAAARRKSRFWVVRTEHHQAVCGQERVRTLVGFTLSLFREGG